jgi:hypothetical protein
MLCSLRAYAYKLYLGLHGTAALTVFRDSRGRIEHQPRFRPFGHFSTAVSRQFRDLEELGVVPLKPPFPNVSSTALAPPQVMRKPNDARSARQCS